MTTKISVEMCRWNTGGAGAKAHPLDESTLIPQLMAGHFLDVLFDCPYELHQLVASPFISGMIRSLTIEHKEVLYYLSHPAVQHHPACCHSWDSLTAISASCGKPSVKNCSARCMTICAEAGRNGLTLAGAAVFGGILKIAEKQGKDAVIRRENKTKRRKKKKLPLTAARTANDLIEFDKQMTERKDLRYEYIF